MSRIKPQRGSRGTATSMFLGNETRAKLSEIVSQSAAAKTVVGVVRAMTERYVRLLRWQKAAEAKGCCLVLVEISVDELPESKTWGSRWEEANFRL